MGLNLPALLSLPCCFLLLSFRRSVAVVVWTVYTLPSVCRRCIPWCNALYPVRRRLNTVVSCRWVNCSIRSLRFSWFRRMGGWGSKRGRLLVCRSNIGRILKEKDFILWENIISECKPVSGCRGAVLSLGFLRFFALGGLGFWLFPSELSGILLSSFAPVFTTFLAGSAFWAGSTASWFVSGAAAGSILLEVFMGITWWDKCVNKANIYMELNRQRHSEVSDFGVQHHVCRETFRMNFL